MHRASAKTWRTYFVTRVPMNSLVRFLEAGVVGCSERDRRPVQIGASLRNRRDEPIVQQARGRHRRARLGRVLNDEVDILQSERQPKTRRTEPSMRDDRAITLV